jgi:hypothetical protein
MHVCGIYMVAILIQLCSLNHISLVWNIENTFARDHGLSFFISFFFLFFMAGIWVPIILDISDAYPFFIILFFLHSHMPLSCNSKTLKRDIYKNLEHLFLTTSFCVFSQCKSRTFWVDGKYVVAYSYCRSSRYMRIVCDLDLESIIGFSTRVTRFDQTQYKHK